MGLLKRVFCLIYSMISTAFLERNLFLYLGFNIQSVPFHMLYFRFFVFRIPTVFQKNIGGNPFFYSFIFDLLCMFNDIFDEPICLLVGEYYLIVTFLYLKRI